MRLCPALSKGILGKEERMACIISLVEVLIMRRRNGMKLRWNEVE